MYLQIFLMMRSFTESKSNRFLEHFIFFSRKFSSTHDLTSCKLDRSIPSVKWVIIVHSEMIFLVIHLMGSIRCNSFRTLDIDSSAHQNVFLVI